jgi:adenylate cyclase
MDSEKTASDTDVVAELVLKEMGSDSRAVTLREGESLRVGRAATNDLVLQDTLVSRFHAVFNASVSGVVVSDLASLNGTFINGRRVTIPVNLRPGDAVSIGNTEVVLRASAAAAAAFGDPTTANTMAAQMRGVMVTVLLADVCGFTRASESLPPADVASMLQTWFSEVSGIVVDNGGEVDKYIGDCVMALWRSTREEAAEGAKAAAGAAVQILTKTRELSISGGWPHHDKHPWDCRLSLNSGEALIGALGAHGSRDFTVLGDSVNVAFRLNDLAGALSTSILISAETAEFLKDNYRVRDLGLSEIEGRLGKVSVFSLET